VFKMFNHYKMWQLLFEMYNILLSNIWNRWSRFVYSFTEICLKLVWKY
jgi:hypothetical protein